MSEKFIFLTGGAKRIGKTTCKHFHDEGFNVIFHYNSSKTEAEEIFEELNSKRKNSCHILQANFDDESSADSLQEGISKITDKLAVLINNASSFYPTPLEVASMKEWNNLLATNATVPLFLTQALLPFLKKGKGCVINISDTLAPSGIKNFSLYSGAKSALEGITKSLAKELAPEIRVNAIAPGEIETSMVTPKSKKMLTKNIPMKRFGTPEEVAGVIHSMCSDTFSYVNGTEIQINGGQTV